MKNYLLLVILVINLSHNSTAQKSTSNTLKKSDERKSFKELNELAKIYIAKPQLDSALLYAQKALEQAEKEFGKKDTNYCNTLTLLFDISYPKHDFSKGIEFCLAEKEIRKSIQGEKHPAYANCLNNLAILHYSQKNYSTAEPLYKEAMIIRKEILGVKDKAYHESLNNLGALYYAKGDFIAAEKLYLEVLNIKKEVYGEKHISNLASLNNLASLYMAMEKYSSAETLFFQSLEISKETEGLGKLNYARCLFNLGRLYEKTGKYAAIEPLFSEAIKIRKKVLGTDHPEYFSGSYEIARVYYQIGNYSAAEPLFLEVMSFYKSKFGDKDPKYVSVLGSLAVMYIEIGNYAAAETIQKEVVLIYKEHAMRDKSLYDYYSSSLTNLAALYHKMGDYASAEPLFLEALKIEKEFFKGKSDGHTENNLAALYRTMGRYDDAEPLFVEALKISKEHFGQNHPRYARALNNLGYLYTKMGKYADSEALNIEALKILKETLGLNSPITLTCMNNLAVLYVLSGKTPEAEELFINANKITRKNIFHNFTILSEKEKESYLKTESGKFLDFYSYALLRKGQNSEITNEVYNSLLSNKGLLLKSSSAMRNSVLSSNDTLLIKQYNLWTSINKELTKLYSIEVSKRKKDPEVLEKQANELEKELVKKSSSMSDFEKLQNISCFDVQKKLKKGEVAIEFLNFTEGRKGDTVTYCALLITPESKNPEMIRLFEEKELTKVLGKGGINDEFFVKTVYGTQSIPNLDLYNLIWNPMEKYLKGVKKVYFSPSGLLHKISFASIPKGKNTYLRDLYELSQLSSTGKIVIPEEFSLNKASNFVVLGGIDYNSSLTTGDTTALLTWPYLEGTKTETDKIKVTLDANKIHYQYFIAKLASEDTFKLISPKANIIHIATHGFFFPDQNDYTYEEKTDTTKKETLAFRGGNNAVGVNNFILNKNPLMRSGIVLAGGNEVWVRDEYMNKEDGVLTAQEVTELDLRKTGLVVLSACETGLGDIKGSEGVYGLQRAFKMAGVKYIIMSLWQVPDAETVEFMSLFYTKLSLSNDIKKSFNEAQKEMRKKYDPFYWAAFVLME